MKTHIFTPARVWKFKYIDVHGKADCMITLDRAKADEWAGRRDGTLVALYELSDEDQVPVLCKPDSKPACEEVKNETD